MGVAVREGGRVGKRKEERERKNKALLSRAEVGCTRQDGRMAGSKQYQLLQEGIPGDCLQRSVQDTGRHWCFGTLSLQAHHDMPPLHERVHGSARAGCSTTCQCCCPLFPLFHTPLEEKSQNSPYPQPQQIIRQGNYFFSPGHLPCSE